MNESNVFNESDLVPFRRRIDELRSIVGQDYESGKLPEAMMKLLERQINECGKSSNLKFTNWTTVILTFKFR